MTAPYLTLATLTICLLLAFVGITGWFMRHGEWSGAAIGAAGIVALLLLLWMMSA